MLAESRIVPISTEGVFDTGRRKPLLVRCRERTSAGSDQIISVVLKTEQENFPPARSIVEALASHWAHCVGLNTPRCWLLVITDEQARILSKDDRLVYPGLAFACEYLPNAFQMGRDNTVSNNEASTILAFDFAIQNSDRTIHNSNCLIYENKTFLIDHESSLDFFVESKDFDPEYGLAYVFPEHIFLSGLRKFLQQNNSLDAICESVFDPKRMVWPELYQHFEVTFTPGLGWEQLAARVNYLKQNVEKSVRDLSLLASR